METWIFTIIYGLKVNSVTLVNANNIFMAFTAAKPKNPKLIVIKMVKLFRKAVKVI